MYAKTTIKYKRGKQSMTDYFWAETLLGGFISGMFVMWGIMYDIAKRSLSNTNTQESQS